MLPSLIWDTAFSTLSNREFQVPAGVGASFFSSCSKRLFSASITRKLASSLCSRSFKRLASSASAGVAAQTNATHTALLVFLKLFGTLALSRVVCTAPS